jgi:DNA adenine methylase
MNATIKHPVLRYHGGKFRMAPWIISHFPVHRVYCEPFGGAASVLMLKPICRQEIYNDLDQEIVNVFRVLRDPVKREQLKESLELTPYSRVDYEQSYKPARCMVERARRTIVRAQLGCSSRGATSTHRTGFRFNDGSKSLWRRSPHLWSRYPGLIASFGERLKDVVIEARPAMELIVALDRKCDGQMLYYVDPPYVLSTRSKESNAKRSYRYDMSDEDHIELARLLHSVKGMVVLSGYDCELYSELYGDWLKISHTNTNDARQQTIECLWISPNAQGKAQLSLMEGAIPCHQ